MYTGGLSSSFRNSFSSCTHMDLTTHVLYTNESIIYNRDYVGQSGGGILSLFLNISEKIEMMYISIQGKLLDNYVKNNQLISWTNIPLNEETKVPISKLIFIRYHISLR